MTDTDPLLVARRYFGSGDPSIIRCACKVGFSVNSPQPEGVRQANYLQSALQEPARQLVGRATYSKGSLRGWVVKNTFLVFRYQALRTAWLTQPLSRTAHRASQTLFD
jgi:hypothetical protein